MPDLTDPIFHDETKARKHLEKLRWADGRFCPHCGAVENTAPVRGRKHRPGLYYCNSCEGQFTVTVGTVLERSKIPLRKWVLAFHLMASSKKGISAHQLHRSLGITYKSAWFMAHRIREAMRDAKPGPMGGEGKVIEADETYIGNVRGSKMGFKFYNDVGWRPRGGGGQAKYKVVSLVERGGSVRSVHVQKINMKTVREILVRKSALMTDEHSVYKRVGKEYARHETVNHSDEEWVRGYAYTNTIEGYFSIFKKGMRGIYQHCGEQHLKRYLYEFDFRYNTRGITDFERSSKALQGIEGKRLTYQQSHKTANG